MKTIGVIDIGSGNFGSLISALNKINCSVKICKNIDDMKNITKFILPGMGSFPNFMKKLNETNISEYLKKKIISDNCSILGICVGFQALFKESNEIKKTQGLGLVKGNVTIIGENKNNIKLPHVGWNTCVIEKKSLIFKNINNNQDFYFCHSYAVKNIDREFVVTSTYYKENFISTIEKANIFGVQFHPEKSQLNGLQVLKNFCDRKC
jgi:glutamine amidotransferase